MARRTESVAWADPALLILGSLVAGPKHGYAMTVDIAEHAGVTLGPGTLYGALSRLESQGLVAALAQEGSRRPYRITGDGEQVLRARLAAMNKFSKLAGSRLKTALP